MNTFYQYVLLTPIENFCAPPPPTPPTKKRACGICIIKEVIKWINLEQRKKTMLLPYLLYHEKSLGMLAFAFFRWSSCSKTSSSFNIDLHTYKANTYNQKQALPDIVYLLASIPFKISCNIWGKKVLNKYS